MAALRFLTEALYRALVHHNRIREHGGRAILSLIHADGGAQALAEEALPCRLDDDHFEPMTRAILRRYVVERCIYAVDLDPLGVELCRLGLWITTLDRRLPFTFLDHKIKPGNSLVGAWFDQFLHYPALAWAREGGDKTHTNGVHFPKEALTRAIKERFQTVRNDLKDFIDGGRLPFALDLTTVQTSHDAAEVELQAIHRLGMDRVAERAERYAALRSGAAFQKMKEAFDLWCALWFWPANELEHAPLPSDFAEGKLTVRGRAIVEQLSRERRFFHWELEFPDVFNKTSHGFDAILGNPPWDISKPNSKEFFSRIDPLYRSYGKQEAANRYQPAFFEQDAAVETRWLEYRAGFKAMSNWVKYAGFPFGDRINESADGKQTHDLNLGDRGRDSFGSSQRRHDRWKQKRETSTGYADADHSFRHQGAADVNLYKLFLEQAHALLADDGRLGFIVPSGLYSDFGTGALRRLFLDQCRWEWLLGFENREAIFDIHRSFKFNAVIVAKGGATRAIRTAFMRRRLADWEHGEQFATDYSREQVVQFSPNSRAILEIQSPRDLEVLTKIYANSVLLGDQSERGWGIKYATEFHMTNDSKLFPPRPKWEEWGYQPDEYSRWIQGPWRPIAELWKTLGVQAPAADQRRCAQPPYDTLPLTRADIPVGIILSRDASQFIREDEIPTVTFTDAGGKALKIKCENADGEKEEVVVTGAAVALPLYEGRMIGQLDCSLKGWVSGKGRSAKWTDVSLEQKTIRPQFLMAAVVPAILEKPITNLRIVFMDVTSATNERTMIASFGRGLPCGNSAPILQYDWIADLNSAVPSAALNSFVCDFAMRRRTVGLHINWFVAEDCPVISRDGAHAIRMAGSNAINLGTSARWFAPEWLWICVGHPSAQQQPWQRSWGVTPRRRAELLAATDVICACAYGISAADFHWMLSDDRSDSKGFWRVDKEKHPEHRQTILSLVAFHDLQDKITTCGGDVAKGIEAFCNQNDGEGWMLPETLRLADYGLGHDERAQKHQPVRACFGPRFHDWQLAQSVEESWKECHLHARNLLGEVGYQKLLAELAGEAMPSAAGVGIRKTEGDRTSTAAPGLFD